MKKHILTIFSIFLSYQAWAMDAPMDVDQNPSLHQFATYVRKIDTTQEHYFSSEQFNRPAAKVKKSSEHDKITNIERFGVAVDQEGDGQHDLANFNYHLAYQENTNADVQNSFNSPGAKAEKLSNDDKPRSHHFTTYVPKIDTTQEQYFSSEQFNKKKDHIPFSQFGEFLATSSYDPTKEPTQQSFLPKKNCLEIIKSPAEFPYCTYGLLNMTFTKDNKPRFMFGTGALVGPRHVLTAAHNLYDRKQSLGPASSIIFSPGKNGQGSCQSFKVTHFMVVKEWIDEKQGKRNFFDFGMAILDKDVGYEVGWLGILSTPLDFLNKLLPPIEIYGYPGQISQGHLNTHYEMAGLPGYLEKQSENDYQLKYKISTDHGQSGSTVYMEIPNCGKYSIGVHAYGAGENPTEVSCNLAVRIDKQKFYCILDWINTNWKNDLSHPLISSQKCTVHYSLDRLLKLEKPKFSNFVSLVYDGSQSTKDLYTHANAEGWIESALQEAIINKCMAGDRRARHYRDSAPQDKAEIPEDYANALLHYKTALNLLKVSKLDNNIKQQLKEEIITRIAQQYCLIGDLYYKGYGCFNTPIGPFALDGMYSNYTHALFWYTQVENIKNNFPLYHNLNAISLQNKRSIINSGYNGNQWLQSWFTSVVEIKNNNLIDIE